MIPSIMAWTKHPVFRFLLPLAFWLGVWQLGAWCLELHLSGKGNELLLPYPITVLTTLLSLGKQSNFWLFTLLSLLRIVSGMMVGTVLGCLLSIATCANTLADQLLSPAIRVVRATPVASFILLVLLWTDRDVVPVVISALMVIPVIWENLCRGIHATDPKLLELARAYRFSSFKILHLVYLPSLRPYLTAGITTSMGLAWKSGIAAEVLCLPKQAIGTEIYQTKLYLEVPTLFAWTFMVISLSLLLERLLRFAFSYWNQKGGQHDKI